MIISAGILLLQAWTFFAGNRCSAWEIDRPNFLVLVGPFFVALILISAFIGGLITFFQGLHYSP